MTVQTIITFDLANLTQVRPDDRYYTSLGAQVIFLLKYGPESLQSLQRYWGFERQSPQLRLQAFVDFMGRSPYSRRPASGFYFTQYFSSTTERDQTVEIVSGIAEQEGDYKFTVGVLVPNGPKFDVDPYLVVR